MNITRAIIHAQGNMTLAELTLAILQEEDEKNAQEAHEANNRVNA